MQYTINSEIFTKSVKRHICDVRNSRLGRDLPTSVNDIAIFPFHKDFIFTKLRICEVSRKKKKKNAKFFKFTVHYYCLFYTYFERDTVYSFKLLYIKIRQFFSSKILQYFVIISQRNYILWSRLPVSNK